MIRQMGSDVVRQNPNLCEHVQTGGSNDPFRFLRRDRPMVSMSGTGHGLKEAEMPGTNGIFLGLCGSYQEKQGLGRIQGENAELGHG